MAWAAAALALATLALVACGGGGGTATGGPPYRSSVAKSATARGVRMEMQMTLNAASLGEPLKMHLSGGVDRIRNRARFGLDLTGIGDLIGFGGLNQWTGKEIVDAGGHGLILYLRIPIFRSSTSRGRWIRLDLAAARTGVELGWAQIFQLMGNPGQTLDWLRATRGRPKLIETERVGGENTTHYRAIVDLARFPRLLPPARRAAARQAIATLRRLTHLTHVRAHPIHVWVGDDGFVRKMSLRFSERIQGERVLVAQIMWFHNFGARVRVRIPPASDTTSMSALAGGG